MRRVKRLNPATVPAKQGVQGELFAAYRHHAIFTDTTLEMLQAETTHRDHAIIEQIHADLRAGALTHLPSASFSANGAWLVLAAIAVTLTRAAGAIASVFHARATTATIRTHLIAVPARIASSARKLTLHLPRDWPWQDGWEALFASICGPPTAAPTCPPSPNRARANGPSGRAGQTGGYLTPGRRSPTRPDSTPTQKPGRWIRAEGPRSRHRVASWARQSRPGGVGRSRTARRHG